MLNTSIIFAIAIATVVSALTYTTCRNLQFPRKVNLGITYSFGFLVLVYLILNPAILQNTVTKVATILIGAVIALALTIRKNAS